MTAFPTGFPPDPSCRPTNATCLWITSLLRVTTSFAQTQQPSEEASLVAHPKFQYHPCPTMPQQVFLIRHSGRCPSCPILSAHTETPHPHPHHRACTSLYACTIVQIIAHRRLSLTGPGVHHFLQSVNVLVRLGRAYYVSFECPVKISSLECRTLCGDWPSIVLEIPD